MDAVHQIKKAKDRIKFLGIISFVKVAITIFLYLAAIIQNNVDERYWAGKLNLISMVTCFAILSLRQSVFGPACLLILFLGEFFLGPTIGDGLLPFVYIIISIYALRGSLKLKKINESEGEKGSKESQEQSKNIEKIKRTSILIFVSLSIGLLIVLTMEAYRDPNVYIGLILLALLGFLNLKYSRVAPILIYQSVLYTHITYFSAMAKLGFIWIVILVMHYIYIKGIIASFEYRRYNAKFKLINIIDLALMPFVVIYTVGYFLDK